MSLDSIPRPPVTSGSEVQFGELVCREELIKQIVEMYLFLAKANKAEARLLPRSRGGLDTASSLGSSGPQVVRVVGKDERYYSDSPALWHSVKFLGSPSPCPGSNTFSKATNFVRTLPSETAMAQRRAAGSKQTLRGNVLVDVAYSPGRWSSHSGPTQP